MRRITFVLHEDQTDGIAVSCEGFGKCDKSNIAGVTNAIGWADKLGYYASTLSTIVLSKSTCNAR